MASSDTARNPRKDQWLNKIILSIGIRHAFWIFGIMLLLIAGCLVESARQLDYEVDSLREQADAMSWPALQLLHALSVGDLGLARQYEQQVNKKSLAKLEELKSRMQSLCAKRDTERIIAYSCAALGAVAILGALVLTLMPRRFRGRIRN